MQKIKKVLSFGAGTQSTGLLLMYLNKDINEEIDLIIFADTGSEPYFVYDYLKYFQDYIKVKYNREIIILKQKYTLEEHIRKCHSGELKRTPALPYYTTNGFVMRQCTVDYKIVPINQYAKKQFNVHKKKNPQKFEMIMGISFDERERMKINQEWYRINKYPLVDLKLNRNDVIKYILNQGLKEPPRSSCYFCPFHSNRYWKMLKNNYPEVFQKAIEFDNLIREKKGMREKQYLSKYKVPLSKIDFNFESSFPELIEECEGYCGV